MKRRLNMGVTRRLIAAVTLSLAVALPLMAEEAPANETLTVEEAVALALQHNRRVGMAAMDGERAEKQVEAARTRRLPSLELQALAGTTLTPVRVTYPAGTFGTFPQTGPIPAAETVLEAPQALSGNVNATLAQPLTQLHRIGLNTKLNEISRDIEQQKLREERAAVAAEVRGLYYQLLQGESGLRAAQEMVETYRELDRVVVQQVAVEAALPSDGLEAKSRLAAEEYKLLQLRGDLATSRERLNQLLGRALDQPFDVVAVPEASLEELDLQAAVAQALESRPDLAQRRLQVEQADTDRRIKKAESIPDVSLAVTYVSFVNVDLVPSNIAMAGLQLKWEPFDWGRRGKERAEKEIQVEQAKSGALEAENQARIEVAHCFRKLQEARLLLEAERLGREAAAERLRVATSRHRVEAALLKDVLQAQAELSGASTQYDAALSTFWTAKADFQKAIGEEL